MVQWYENLIISRFVLDFNFVTIGVNCNMNIRKILKKFLYIHGLSQVAFDSHISKIYKNNNNNWKKITVSECNLYHEICQIVRLFAAKENNSSNLLKILPAPRLWQFVTFYDFMKSVPSYGPLSTIFYLSPQKIQFFTNFMA